MLMLRQLFLKLANKVNNYYKLYIVRDPFMERKKMVCRSR